MFTTKTKIAITMSLQGMTQKKQNKGNNYQSQNKLLGSMEMSALCLDQKIKFEGNFYLLCSH